MGRPNRCDWTRLASHLTPYLERIEKGSGLSPSPKCEIVALLYSIDLSSIRRSERQVEMGEGNKCEDVISQSGERADKGDRTRARISDINGPSASDWGRGLAADLEEADARA